VLGASALRAEAKIMSGPLPYSLLQSDGIGGIGPKMAPRRVKPEQSASPQPPREDFALASRRP